MKSFFLHRAQVPSPLPLRKRVRSVQTTIKRELADCVPEEDILKKLQERLEKELGGEEWLPTEPSVLLPETHQLRIQNKLWKYFLGRMELVSGKVEKERLNACQRELHAIKQQIVKRREANKNHIKTLQTTIHSNNQDIHALFEQIKLERISQENAAGLLKNKKKRQQDQPEIAVTHNAPVIRQKIEVIRAEISKAEEAIKHYEGELQKIQEEWKSFLKHFLKQGFYFQDGVMPILKEMVAIGYTPSINDFPAFLDTTSKQCLLAEHAYLREQLENAPKREVSMSEHITESKKNMRLLVKKDNLLRIYDGTKDYMMSWVRNQGWKQETGFPRIQSTQSATQKTVIDWRAEQKKRLNFIDDKQRYRKVRAVLFGSKVETIV